MMQSPTLITLGKGPGTGMMSPSQSRIGCETAAEF